ncbi:uncharacterized protein METZ01_LOCUS231776, partial [marine metagenome]
MDNKTVVVLEGGWAAHLWPTICAVVWAG